MGKSIAQSPEQRSILIEDGLLPCGQGGKVKALIAEDDLLSRLLLERMLAEWDYEAVAVSNGAEALRCLRVENAPKLAVLDWVMPEMEGPEMCRRLRALPSLLASPV